MADTRDDDAYRGRPRPPENKYSEWGWKDVQAALTGAAAVGDDWRHDHNLGKVADPETLKRAAHDIIAATERIRDASDILVEGTNGLMKNWQGPAAQAFCGLMLRVCGTVDSVWATFADGATPYAASHTGRTPLAQSLHAVGWTLEQAQGMLRDIDQFYAKQVIDAGYTVIVNGEVLARVSAFPHIVAEMDREFRFVMNQVATRYYIEALDGRTPPQLQMQVQVQGAGTTPPALPPWRGSPPGGYSRPALPNAGKLQEALRRPTTPSVTGRSVVPAALTGSLAGSQMPMYPPMMPPMMPGGMQAGNRQNGVPGGRPIAQVFPGAAVESTNPQRRSTAPGVTPVVRGDGAKENDQSIPSRRSTGSVYRSSVGNASPGADGADERVLSTVGVAAVPPVTYTGAVDATPGSVQGGHAAAPSASKHDDDDDGPVVVPVLFWRGRRRKDKARQAPPQSRSDESLGSGGGNDALPGHVVGPPATPSFAGASGVLRQGASGVLRQGTGGVLRQGANDADPAPEPRARADRDEASPSEHDDRPPPQLDLGEAGVLPSSTSFTGSAVAPASAAVGSVPVNGQSRPPSGTAGVVSFFSEEGARLRAAGRAPGTPSLMAMIEEHEARAAASPPGGAADSGAGSVGTDGKRGASGTADGKDHPEDAIDRFLTEDKATWMTNDDVAPGILGRPSGGERKGYGGN